MKMTNAGMRKAKVSLLLISVTFAIIYALPVQAVTQAQVNAAIANGLAWLASQQNADGSWGDVAYPNHKVAKTGLAVLKFERYAIDQGMDPFSDFYQYRTQVNKGLNYIFLSAYTIPISPQPAGNPDTPPGDGLGVYMVSSGSSGQYPYRTYETGISMMALAASTHPGYVVYVPGSAVYGWTYKAVLQDAVDYLAFGQNDAGGSWRGGWGYHENDSGSDNSNTGYAVIGLTYAEASVIGSATGFGCTIPSFVKTELVYWIKYIQAIDGGSGYTSPTSFENILKTGNLLFEMSFAGYASTHIDVQRAIDYIVNHWNDPNLTPGWKGSAPPASYQAMYTTMEGLEIFFITLIGGIDWQADFDDVLVAQQNPNGSWPNCAYSDNDFILSTEWALLVLEKAVPTNKPHPTSPTMATKLMMIYNTPTAEWSALKAGEFDVMDWPLSAPKYQEWLSNPTLQSQIGLQVEKDMGVYAFDINANATMTGLPGATYSYPGIPSPTADVNFRRAIAKLVDKVAIAMVDFQGFLEITDVPLTTPVHQAYINPSVVGGSYAFKYNLAQAAADLDAAGYTVGTDGYRINAATGNSLYDDLSDGTNHGLIFYIRSDLPELWAAGLRFANALTAAKIPVKLVVASKPNCFHQVMGLFGYHLYTSYRKLGVYVDHLHDWYSAQFANPYDYNYMLNNAMYIGGTGPQVISTTLESQLDNVKYATPNQPPLITAAHNAENLLWGSSGTVPSIILGRYIMFTAYRNGWKGIVNERGRGVKNWYTEAMAYNPTTGASVLRVGLHNTIYSLNPVTAPSEENIDFTHWNVLWEIYDSLIREDPYTPTNPMSMGLADDWKVKDVADPQQNNNIVTWMEFHLRPNAKWHDGSPVTDADVKFSIDYHEASEGTFYSDVMDVNRVQLMGNNWIEVYMNTKAFLAPFWIGGVPIIPRSIWQNVPDPFVYDPIAAGTVIGSGPWMFDSYVVNDHVKLNANTNWYLTTAPNDNPGTPFLYDLGDVERGVMEAFHRVGDIDYDADVDVVDFSTFASSGGISAAAYQAAPIPFWRDDQYANLIFSPTQAGVYMHTTGWAESFDWIGVIYIGTNWYDGYHMSSPFSPFWGNHPWRAADFNYNNLVFIDDLVILAQNWGRKGGIW